MSPPRRKARASIPGQKGRILPKSKADVEAALAAVRARTAKMRLEASQKSNDLKKEAMTIRNNASSKKTSTSTIERRQPSSETRRATSSTNGSLDPSTLKSVTQYLGKLNSNQTFVPKQTTQNQDDDDDSSSDDSYGVSNVNLKNISAMIDKVQKPNPNPKPMIQNDSSSDDDSLPDAANAALINALMDKVRTTPKESPKTGREIRPLIQSPASDISTDDSSVGAGDVSAAQQANLAMYIDSLNSTQVNQPQETKLSSTGANKEKSKTSPNENVHESIESYRTSQVGSPWKDTAENVEMAKQTTPFLNTKSPTTNPTPMFSYDTTTFVGKNSLSVEEKSPNKALIVTKKVPVYDKIKLQSYIDKAKEVAEKNSPSIAEVEYIIIYARRDGIPIKPILTTLDKFCRGPAKFSVSDKSGSPTKGLFNTVQTLSTDGGLLDTEDDLLDAFVNNNNELVSHTPAVNSQEKVFSIPHRNIQRFIFFLDEAITLIESAMVTPDAITDLTERAIEEKFDATLLQQILKNPKKHIVFVEEDDDDDVVVLKLEEMGLNQVETNKSKQSSNEEFLLWSNTSKNSEIDIENIGMNAEKDIEIQLEGSLKPIDKDSSIEGVIDEDGNRIQSQSQLPNEGDETQGEGTLFFDNEQESEASSVHSVHNPPPLNHSTPDTSPEDNRFHLQMDSKSEEKSLDSNEKYYLNKIKQLDRAKQFATGTITSRRVNKDGSQTIYTSKPPILNPVTAAKKLYSRRMCRNMPSLMPGSYLQQWKIPPKDRIVGRPSYEGVHSKSLLDATAVNTTIDLIDGEKWEDRDVNQFFFGDVDLTLKANWFGTLHSIRLNKRLSDPVSQPKSVIMEVMTYPHKWEEEWYTTWYSRKHNPNKEGDKRKERARKRTKRSKKKKKKSKSKRSRRYREEESEEEDVPNMPEIPEIGNIYTLRFRGEKTSLVHLAFISYLSKSRWKQKYFPKGIFAHD